MLAVFYSASKMLEHFSQTHSSFFQKCFPLSAGCSVGNSGNTVSAQESAQAYPQHLFSCTTTVYHNKLEEKNSKGQKTRIKAQDQSELDQVSFLEEHDTLIRVPSTLKPIRNPAELRSIPVHVGNVPAAILAAQHGTGKIIPVVIIF